MIECIEINVHPIEPDCLAQPKTTKQAACCEWGDRLVPRGGAHAAPPGVLLAGLVDRLRIVAKRCSNSRRSAGWPPEARERVVKVIVREVGQVEFAQLTENRADRLRAFAFVTPLRRGFMQPEGTRRVGVSGQHPGKKC